MVIDKHILPNPYIVITASEKKLLLVILLDKANRTNWFKTKKIVFNTIDGQSENTPGDNTVETKLRRTE